MPDRTDILIRPAKKGDGPPILILHRRAIHETVQSHYSQDILNAWGPPIASPTNLARKGDDFDAKVERGQSLVVVAEIHGSIAGFGEIAPADCHLVAVYVDPDFQRRGVGSAILKYLEQIATDRSLPHLQMSASLPAIPFYLAHGYQIVEEGFHSLGAGKQMACMKMCKQLSAVENK
ncbi:MAG: GNAT family N-acetyltransferase [Tepidisphaeraceae bacterium]|jgi:GNAT superfamily N-acetyltransferase